MINVLCYCDSNTYGYNPFNGGRYDLDERWTGRLQTLLGKNYRIIEEGLNNRTTVLDDPLGNHLSGKEYFEVALRTHYPVDLVIIMLGSNDLKIRFNMPAVDIAEGAGKIVEEAIRVSKIKSKENKPCKILLVAPIHIGEEIEESPYAESFGGKIAREKSLKFAKYYKQIADQYGVYFMDAGFYVNPSPEDALHLDAEGHRILAYAFRDKIKEIME